MLKQISMKIQSNHRAVQKNNNNTKQRKQHFQITSEPQFLKELIFFKLDGYGIILITSTIKYLRYGWQL